MLLDEYLVYKYTKEKYIYTLLGTAVVFLVATVMAYFLAHEQGNQGITWRLFGEGDDGNFYWEQIQNIINDSPWIKTSIYPLIVGEILKFMRVNSVLAVRLINYTVLLMTIHTLLSLVRQQCRVANVSDIKAILIIKMNLLIMLLLYASFVFNISLSILRDVWIYGLYAMGVLISATIFQKKKINLKDLLGLCITLYLLGEFRGYALISFLVALSIHLLFSRKWIKDSTLVLLGIGILFVIYTFFMDTPFPVVNKSLAEGLNYRLTSIEQYAGGSQMWINLNQSNFLLFLLNYLHSFMGNLLGPLPWHIKGSATVILFVLETIPMLYILSYIWRKRRFLTSFQKYIILHAFTWIGMIALSNDNIGTASRLRPICWLLMITVFCVLRYTSSEHKHPQEVAVSEKQF